MRDEAPVQQEGITPKGLPFSQRGGLIVDVAGLRLSGARVPLAAIDVVARIPIADHTQLEAVLPLGYGALGNPMIGVRHVFRPAQRMWVTLGGAFGFPLISNDQFVTFAYSRAFWDTQEFLTETVPFATRVGFESHFSSVELRAELDPVFGISTDHNGTHYFALQHAFEVQAGHAIGGGLRYQGVLVATNPRDILGRDDHYQGAFEPFFRLYHDPVFLRLGLLLPLDNPLGKPFDQSWGMRATLGYSLD